jgi:hypothetical protein
LLPLRLPGVIFSEFFGLWFARNSLKVLVGVRGFEPPAPSSRTRCATRLRYTPPRRRTSSPAATCSGALIAAPWRAGKPNGQTTCSLCSLTRHTFAPSVRDSLAPADFEPAPCLKTGPMRHTPALRNIKNRSGDSCGSSVVEHSLGKGEAESSILSRSTSKTQRKSIVSPVAG